MFIATTKCPECCKRIRKGVHTCPRCGYEISEDQTKRKPKWHERTSVSLCVATLLVVIGLGFIHVIVGVRGPGDLPFDLALRESFGYKELIVDVVRIQSLPYLAVTLKHPLGLRVLQAKGYFPSDPTLETQMIYRMREMMNLWYAEFESSLDRSERPWQEQMQHVAEEDQADPQSAEAFNARAIVSSRQGRFDAALTELAAAIRKNPVLAEAFYNRALIYKALGNLGQAASDLDKVVEIRPRFVEACVERGRILVTLEQYDEAIADFSQAIEIDPAGADAYLWRGMVHFAKGDNDEARQDVHNLQKLEMPVPKGLLAALQIDTEKPTSGTTAPR